MTKKVNEVPDVPQKEHRKSLFAHSACCNAHWELVLHSDQTGELLCEKCGKSAGTTVKITHGVTVNNCQCEECIKRGEDQIPGEVLTDTPRPQH